jgi:hypothetical protein
VSGRAAVGGRVPHDQGLPQLRRLLDVEAMASVLDRSLRPGERVSDVRVLYLRYKPGTRLVVRYGVTIGDGRYDATALAEPAADLAGWATDPEHVALARKVDGRAPALAALSYDEEVGALIQWLPLDLTLPVIAEAPGTLRALLRTAGVELAGDGDAPTFLAYKARRRAVLRLDGHVVKVYAGAADFENAVVGLEASRLLAALDVPRSEAVLPEHRLTCQTLLAGRPPTGHHAAARAAGSALAVLHGAPRDGLRPFPPDRQLAAAASSARSAAAVAPELAPRLERLVDELAAAKPDGAELVTAHGDFHANQVLDRNGGLAVIDFDEICAAPAGLDFSSYVAHLLSGMRGELAAAAGALDDLVEGYGARPEALGWYVSTSILRRSPFPFRFLDEDWPNRIEQMVVDAEEALAL